MNCLLGDAGIAVGLTSLPFRHERDFYRIEIAESLFPKYKEAVLKHFSGSGTKSLKEFKSYFYQPIPYYLFGSFDLAVITLVDDFEMTARTFRPFDPMLSTDNTKPYRENFFYKVITGPTPHFREGDSVVDLAARAFLANDRAPLFAMSLFKLNNALLLGTGTDFMRQVIRFVHELAKEQEKQNPNFRVILLESHAAHEITLLVFTDSYSSATRLITEAREARAQSLLRLQPSGEARSFENLLRNSLLAELANPQSAQDSLKSAPLFADSESYFGFDFRLLDPGNTECLDRIDSTDQLNLLCQWSVRPGDLLSSINELRQEESGKISISIGRGDLFIDSKELPTREVIRQLATSLAPEASPRHARRRHTIPAVSLAETTGDCGDSSYDFTNDLNRMRFTVGEIKDIQDRLRAVQTPKILTAKVLNAFTNFNDGILDPSLCGYFVELLPLMESIQQTVSTWATDPSKVDIANVCSTLEKVTDNFERAYRNRFHNSYRMGDVTDFNLDFKGGVQQLLTSFDSAYKAICSVLGNPRSFVYVAGSPGVYSTSYEVRLNYYHVFQPEIFGCIANHEAANSYLARYNSQDAPSFARDAGLIALERDQAASPPCVLETVAALSRNADSVQTALLRYVTRRLFNYVLIDLLAFYFGYNRNLHLFSHWYWGYFIQNSSAYMRKGTIDRINVVSFTLRMLWIHKLLGLEIAPITFGDKQIDDFVAQAQSVFADFVEWLFSMPVIDQWNRQVLTHVESQFKTLYQQGGETIVQITNRLESQANQLQRKLKRGEVCLYSREHPQSPFIFTEQVLYAYLSLLADRFGSGGILLNRGDEGHPDISSASSKALFDPIGGIFTHDPETRRDRFRYRAALAMSLWDMGLKEKKELVLGRLNRVKPRAVAAGLTKP